jgi:hypothetical protein
VISCKASAAIWLSLAAVGQPAAIDPPSAQGSLSPSLAIDREAVLISWIEPTKSGHRLVFSRFERARWSDPVPIVESDALIASWADVPTVTASNGVFLASFAEKSGEGGGYAYDVQLARSTDGKRWKRLGPANDDHTRTEHGFVSVVPESAGTFRIFWLDGRATASGGATALRTAIVGEAVKEQAQIDDRACDCCATGAARAESGAVVAYRDRSADEIRDIALVRRAGDGFSSPQVVHDDGWKTTGCPVNGPAIDARKDEVAVAWTTGADRGHVRLAFSSNGGKTFGAPIEIATGTEGEAPIGRVSVALEGEGKAVVSWVSKLKDEAEISLRRASSDGRLGEPIRLGKTAGSRGSGFPKIVVLGGEIIAAWSEPGAKGKIRAVRLIKTAVPQPR